MNQSESIDRLVAQFTKLPSVGKKTALRYAYAIVDMDDAEVQAFANSLLDVKQKVHFCRVCGNYTDQDTCEICETRNPTTICVVAEPKDIQSFEKLREYTGVYHVLHGQLNPLRGVGVDELNIRSLLPRVSSAAEVILATNPDVEGDATAMYIAGLIKPLGVKVTRIARGIPAGSEIEYSDEATLAVALNNRKEI